MKKMLLVRYEDKRMSDRDKQLWLIRLSSWEDELETNTHKMAGYAPRAIKLLRDEIEEFWPGDLGESDD